MTFGKDDARCPVFGALSKDAAIYGMSLVNAETGSCVVRGSDVE
jgi:hypothetical protein